ncbi:uncharacterized protein LOC126964430 [Leptidea sinapis]|uniref:uncharacterized protein LOC126964430 n=1 Tax=Leptidea sinapis TaxID=189913 RepID=UPI00214378E7|nr:uncharacterized protein LOC126964430 [Leptidea sinapis]XP_050663490.1 uncharacterized protein LOC126964430 [Leptidea sinapis]XP_050663491.1 uncharacterized protein LOC126964430 [Leptidea sinapis]
MVFQRPDSLPFPKVWHRFPAKGTMVRIQDLTDDQVEPAVQLLVKYFMTDEPPCKYIGVQNHPVAKASLEQVWRNTIKERMSIVCVEDVENPKEIISVNVLTVADKNDKREPFQTDDKVWGMLFGAVDFVCNAVDPFKMYGVDKYLSALGLVVDPKWRGCAIGKEMLLARVPICKALGLKVTVTVFTAGASQAVAKKLGYKVIYEITYKELAEKGFVFPGIEENTKSSMLMSMEIE